MCAYQNILWQCQNTIKSVDLPFENKKSIEHFNLRNVKAILLYSLPVHVIFHYKTHFVCRKKLLVAVAFLKKRKKSDFIDWTL